LKTLTKSERSFLRQVIGFVAEQYGQSILIRDKLCGGEESDVFRVEANEGTLALRISPAWRSFDELLWAYRRARETQARIPQVTAPLLSKASAPLIVVGGRPVSIFPFVDGERLDRDDDGLREQAARLLAELHAFFLRQPRYKARPASSPENPTRRRPKANPEAIIDADLDSYLAKTHDGRMALLAPIHGDFYPGNILCRGGEIRGLIDWDDCRVGSLYDELAWSVWEFCKDPKGRNQLVVDRACQFFRSYAAAGGPVPTENLRFVVPLIRQHLRVEIRSALAAKEAGEAIDEDYLREELEAFANLKGLRLRG
jgi:Ser/Thr protein kinase RdoA (MazF antagonist)